MRNLSALRAKAATSCSPSASVCFISSRPVPPLAPKMTMRVVPPNRRIDSRNVRPILWRSKTLGSAASCVFNARRNRALTWGEYRLSSAIWSRVRAA
jgi:hypothetical protein